MKIPILILSLQLLFLSLNAQSNYYFIVRDGENNKIIDDITITKSEKSKIIIETQHDIYCVSKIKKKDFIIISCPNYINEKISKNAYLSESDTTTIILIPTEEEMFRRFSERKKNTSFIKDTILITSIDTINDLVLKKFAFNNVLSYHCSQHLSDTYKIYLLFGIEEGKLIKVSDFVYPNIQQGCFLLYEYLEVFIQEFPIFKIATENEIDVNNPTISIPITIRIY